MRAVRMTLLSMVLVFMGAAAAAAQNTGTVTGQVTDATTGEPLTGVQMQVAGTNVGGLTDQNGRYLLTRVPLGEQRIRAVLIGYAQQTETVTVTAAGTATADFALSTSAVPLEAVIVSAATGREQRARELGAKVSAIEVEDLNPAPVTSFADAIGGRSEGVIMQDVNGTTGTAQRIRIRGANSLSLSNEPLVFIDGVQMGTDIGGTYDVGGQETSRLNDINPNDIANIEIVKGPAASALYGTAAANGVILITTKRGRPGNTQWTAFAETGWLDDVTDYPDNYFAYQINDPDVPLRDEEGNVIPGNVWFGAAYSPCYNRLAAAGACTQDGVLRFQPLEDDRTSFFQTGLRQRYGASVRGGTEQVRYFVSGQYEDEEGVISFNTQQKANIRANLDAELAENVDLGVSFGYTDVGLALNNNDNSIFSPIINGLLGEAYYVPPTEDQPDQVNRANYWVFGFNPTDIGYLPTYQDVDRYIGSANLRWRPTSWLTVNTTGGLDLTSDHAYETLQPDRLNIAESYTNGYRASTRSTDYLYSLQGSGVATFDLSQNLLSTTTVGGSYTQDNSTNTSCYGSYLVPGQESCGSTTRLFSLDEDFFEIRTLGGYVQQELAWNDRVFLAAGIRADDNSAFGQDFELAYYPSASLSWVVAEEQWFPELDFLTTLRLRGAWGVSGLRPGFRDALDLWVATAVASNAGDDPGILLNNWGNNDLKPERSAEYELGFDTGLFDDRLSVEFTYFNKTSEDAIVSRNLPGSLGITGSQLENLGSMRNSGTELAMNLLVFENDVFGLNLGFTNTMLENEIEDLGGVPPIIFNRGLQRHTEGRPAGAFFQRELSWVDEDGDGKLSIDDVTLADTATYIGPSLPTWQRSFSADVRLFQWITISSLIEGRGGHYTGNDSEAFRCGVLFFQGCAAVADPEATLFEQARYIADNYLGSAYGFVEEADFYKWRELAVTISTPGSWAERFQALEGLRFTFAGRNLATWTDYTGLDPETVEGGASANFSQSEFNTQPPVRYLMLRLDYTF